METTLIRLERQNGREATLYIKHKRGANSFGLIKTANAVQSALAKPLVTHIFYTSGVGVTGTSLFVPPRGRKSRRSAMFGVIS